MSNDVYPSLPGLTWDITRTPTWSTTVKTALSLREYRQANASFPVYHYKLTYGVLRQKQAFAELATLAGFYNKHQGGFASFLFNDPDDNAVVAQLFGTGDGTTTAFQLARSFGGASEPVFDVNGSAGAAAVFANGYPVNLVLNGDMEARTGNQPYGYAAYNNGAISVSFTNPTPWADSYAFGLKANASTSSTFGLMGGPGVNPVGAILSGGPRPTWQPFTTYTVAFVAKKVNGAGWSGVGLAWNTAPVAGAFLNPNLTTSYQQYYFTFTFGASVEATGAIYITVNGNTVANDEIDIDGLQIFVGPVPTGGLTFSAASFIPYSLSQGLVTFDSPPAAAVVLTWTGSFYRRCRFLTDSVEFNKQMAGLWEVQAGNLELISVKP